MNNKQRQYAFLALALIGLCATWLFNLQFIREHQGFSAELFVAMAYANNASASISNDVVVAAISFLLWSWFESRRLAMRYWLLWPALTFGVALAFAFPLFLALRERKLAALSDSAP